MAEFWRHKTLAQLSAGEWESLCDRCGRCCLLKLEDEDNGDLYFTNIACRHLQQPGCRCSHYPTRTRQVPECLALTPDSLPALIDHLPVSCAYKRLYQGLPLPSWHPLISTDPASVERAGISVSGKVISEDYIHPEQYPEHIIQWHNWQGEE
ncbi:MAG: YcgN family cysteine cluster protein [Thiohalophilus sp.]